VLWRRQYYSSIGGDYSDVYNMAVDVITNNTIAGIVQAAAHYVGGHAIQMMQVFGIGKSKSKKYGTLIWQVIHEWIKEEGIHRPYHMQPPDEPEPE
jgi:hypothetical protein